jgi:hypothetical protein
MPYRQVMREIPERDWKYLAGVKGEMLAALCRRINEGARRIASDRSSAQHETFLRLYSYIVEQNEAVADCFDDWRRSNVLAKLFHLRRHGVLTGEHQSRLSAETRERVTRTTPGWQPPALPEKQD